MTEQNVYTVKNQVADPTTLGLFGLAIVTMVAASNKLGITSDVSGILPWAIFLGGFAQLIACIFDFKHNNLFGASAFGAYGLFWIGVSFTWMTKFGYFGDPMKDALDMGQFGFALLGYVIFSIFMTISTLKMNPVMFVLLILIDILLFALMMYTFTHVHAWGLIAGIAEAATSLVTFYALGAKYLNAFFGRTMMPVGKPMVK
ncbi:MAG: YaaH family transporter [Bacteroidetes bacterium]|nr:YaaH family transporter [Bacteroidota bacterium]